MESLHYSENNCAPINILLVDDTEADVKITLRAFEKARLRNNIFVVQDGDEALDFLNHRGEFSDHQQYPRPGIILLDINMPKIDGFEVLKAIKTDDNLKTIPVVMLTSSKDHQDVLKSYNYGASSYIPKPVDYGEFLRVVESFNFYWSIINRLPDDGARSNGELETPSNKAQGVDVSVTGEGSICSEEELEIEEGIKADAKIIIIDDSLPDQKLLHRLLSKKGYEHFFFSETAEAGLELAQKIMPDIMLVDTQLPGMNGFEMCRKIKDQFGDQIKVVVMTGAIEAIDATVARESGTDSYCAKTRDCQHLCESIKKLLASE